MAVLKAYFVIFHEMLNCINSNFKKKLVEAGTGRVQEEGREKLGEAVYHLSRYKNRVCLFPPNKKALALDIFSWQ